MATPAVTSAEAPAPSDPEALAPEQAEALEQMRQWVDQLYEDSLRPMPRRVAKWRENMSFFRGFQHLVPTSWSEESWGSIDPRQEFETENRIQAIVFQSASKMLQAFPLNPEVIASHDGVVARARAEASARLVASFPRNGVIPFGEVYDAALAVAIFGGAYLQPFWDPMAGPRAVGPDGVKRPLGDIRVRCVTLLDALPDPLSKSEAEDRHVFHRLVLPLSAAREMFPQDVFGADAEFMKYGARTGEGFAALMSDDRGLFESVAATEPNQLVEIVWYYERPTPTHPEGRIMAFSGPVILDVDVRLPNGVWPWIWIPGPNRAPGVRIPDGLVHNLKGPQRSLNHALSKIRENATLCTNPALLAPNAAGIQTEKLDDLPGTVLRYNATGGKPEFMQVPGIPPGLYDSVANTREALGAISSYSDVSQGQPQGDLSGRAILNLDQLNNMVHGPLMGMFREAIVELMQACLRIAHERYDEGRLVLMFGENNQWTSRAWKGDDFDPDLHIVLDPFSQKPSNPAAKFAQAVEIAGLQGYEDTPAAKRFREAAGADDVDSDTLEISAVHKRRAKDEDIQLVTTGVAPPPLFADDDAVHLDCHLVTFLSAEVQNNPALAQALEQHMAVHEMNMAQKMGAMQPPEAQAPPGGPGEGPPGAEAAPPGPESPVDGGAPAGFDTARDVGEALGQGIEPGAGMSNAGPGG